MSRLRVLAAHPRRTLATLAVVLTAVGITAGSGASFTASAANAGNIFATGTLSIANTPGTAVFNASGMKPGDVNTGTVDIQNTGTLAGDFKVATASPTGSTALLNQLDLAVADCGVWTGGVAPTCAATTGVYSGKLGALTTAALGAFAGGVKHRYRFTVTLPSTTDDTFQAKTAQVDFAWSATQS